MKASTKDNIRIKLSFNDINKIIHFPKTFSELKAICLDSYQLSKSDQTELEFYYLDNEKEKIALSIDQDLDMLKELLNDGLIKSIKIFVKESKKTSEISLGNDFANPVQEDVIMQTDYSSKNAQIQTEKKKQIEQQSQTNQIGLKNQGNQTNNQKNQGNQTIHENKANKKEEKEIKKIIKKTIKKQFKKVFAFLGNTLKEVEEKEKLSQAKENLIEGLLKSVSKKIDDPKCHLFVKCKGCGKMPIQGVRYKCNVCKHFDYCEKCEEKYASEHGHAFIKLVNKDSIKILKKTKKENKKATKNEELITCLDDGNMVTKNNTTFYKGLITFKNVSRRVLSYFSLKCVESDEKLIGETYMVKKPIAPFESFEVPIKFDLRNLDKKTKTYKTKWRFFDEKKVPMTKDFEFVLNYIYDKK